MHTDYARFMTIDPMFHKTPDFWFAQPQMQNAYSYAVNNPVKYNDPSGEVVPLLAAWAAFEVSMAVYDTYDLAHTLSNKNASTQTKAVTVGAYAAGLYLPGGGYGILGRQSVKHADEAVAMVKNAPEVGKAAVNSTSSIITNAKNGNAFETYLGMTQVKKRIISITETAKGRFPDRMTDTTIEEAKNVNSITRVTNQINDELLYAKREGKQFILHVAQRTQIKDKVVQEITNRGGIIVRHFFKNK